MSNSASRTVTRRSFVSTAAAASLAGIPLAGMTEETSSPAMRVDLHRQPDLVSLRSEIALSTSQPMQKTGGRWTAGGAELSILPGPDGTALQLHAPAIPITHLHLRWRETLPESLLVLGDAWERSYGDLQWLPVDSGRALPWYFVATSETAIFGCGVQTGASCFAFWQLDPRGISLWLDLRNGGNGVLLGDRILPLATLVQHSGEAAQNSFAVTQALCRKMASGKVIPMKRGKHGLHALYGSNDWYYAYGRNTADGILRDADLMAEIAPAGETRPYTVVDDGYQDRTRFPDMAALASSIRGRTVTPGIWIRPLRAPANTPETWLVPAAKFGARRGRAEELAFDPTVPEAHAAIMAVVREAAVWGYDLIKHDFTTYELLGQWGSQMGPSPTLPGWHFHDRTRTNAEIVSTLYRHMRAAAGEDRILLGCNTIGHLSVGLFDAQRTGDDVSGRVWERTRRMGVNTLAFRLPQHRAFFSLDADCVPLTRDIPWEMTRQWLDVVARTGTVLLTSPAPDAIGPEQKSALREAFARSLAIGVAQPAEPSQAVDWLKLRTPEFWKSGAETHSYTWTGVEGADPFLQTT